jgi:uncharacterized repeat protein (TIGR01451 family)
MQSAQLRRITNTTEEGINLNPSISGDGRVIGFESTEDVAGAGGADHFRAIRGSIDADLPSFFQIAGSRSTTPAISQDGSRVAFASRDDVLGINNDGNSEIFLFDGAKLIQVTNTSPGNLSNRITNGNFQPSISDDGRFIAFSSNRDLAAQNNDGNFEIFVYDVVTNSFTQLTNSSGIVGATDAKISGDGSTVAYIRDNGVTASTARDLMKQPRTGGSAIVLAASVQSLAMTYGRAISDDGARVVYATETATNTTQVFLFDGRTGGTIRQITSLGARVTEVPLNPTISGDGSRIAFAARRAVSGAGSNSDGGVDLYVSDLPTSTFSKITNAPSSATAEVVSSLNDDGSTVVFNFPRVLSGAVVNGGTENNSEIYAMAPPARPASGTLTAIFNDASFGHEPATAKAVATNAIAVAQGTNLASTTTQSQLVSDGTYPTSVAGTRVTVNGRATQIFFVSPTQINFLVPPQTEIGSAEVVVTNAEDFPSRNTVTTLRAAPGIFTRTGDGIGEGLILNGDTLQEGPFDPTSGNLHLSIFATGVRNAAVTTVSIGGRTLNAESVLPSTTMPGLDEVHVQVPADLRGAGTVNLSLNCDGRDSNPVTVGFLGDPSRAIFFNEILAAPPTGLAGDANNDGVRDGTEDEFVELVNGSGGETVGMSGWTIKTRTNGSTTETTRFIFPAGTSLAAGTAAIIFGGGTFNPADPIFGCAQVFKATSSAGLSLTNTGLTILLRDPAGNLIAQFAYGGSTGLDGNSSQSLTRSPDISGGFVLHTAANASRRFSPGLKVDGTPFGACVGHLARVTISPISASGTQGNPTQFTAQALDQFGRPIKGIMINFISDSTTVATIDSTSINAANGAVTANVSGRTGGVAHIIASATDGTTTVDSSPATFTVAAPLFIPNALSVNDVSLNEGNSGATVFTFIVSMTQPAASGGVKFDIATRDGTATAANNDYVPRALTNQLIPEGAQTYSFDVTVNGDTNIEPDENFFVTVSNVSGISVAKGQGTGTIHNDDSPTLRIDDVSANEGNNGTTRFTFTVSTPIAAGPGGITFDVATADSTATAASGDYIARALTGQTIPEGQLSYTFDVTVNGDTLVEPNETFRVKLTNVSGAQVNNRQAQGTIVNDDTPNLLISQIYPGGGLSNAIYTNDFIELYNHGTSTIDFAVTPYSAQFLSTNGSTWVKTDLTSGTVAPGHYFLIKETSGGSTGSALPAADATGTINLTSTTDGKVALVTGSTLLAGSCPGDDGTQPLNPSNVADFVGYGGTAATPNHCYEGSGPSSLTLSNNTIADFRKAGGCVDTNDNASDFFTARPNPRNIASATGDCKPEVTINDVTVTESNSGTVNATFTVNLSAPSAQTVKVDFATADGTATAPVDYQSNSGTLTFNPGDLTRTITVIVNGDTLDEPNETFVVNLMSALNAVILDNQGQGTINDNDSPPSLSINDVAVSEGNNGTTPATFTVSLSAPSGFTITVDYATADNSANSSSDYQAANGTVTFNPGETSRQVTVLVNGDADFEQNESFFVNLGNAVNASIADGQGVGTINNDDPLPPTPNFFINDVSVNEGDGGTKAVDFTVTLTPASSQPVTVQYATADGTATAGADYRATNGTLSFNANETSKTISVNINGDTLVESDETFFVNLSNPSAGTNLGGPQGLGTIQNDDQASLVISQVYPGGGLTGATYTNDFVELYNRATATVDFSVTPYSVQFLSTGGSSWTKTDLTSGTIAPGHYFLIKEASGGAAGAALPTSDAAATINLTSTTAGKVALVSNTTLLTGNCPGDDGPQPFNPSVAAIADFVGYLGTAATANHCYEGSGPASFNSGSNTTAEFRKAGGCVDKNDNVSDFFVAQPAPRNSTSPVGDCKPEIIINDVTVTEGNTGTVNATFTVTLTAASTQAVTVDFATGDRTATAPADYQSNNGTLTFNPGDLTRNITVLVNGDTLDETNETFFVMLSNAANGVILDSQGIGTIADNDPPPSISINDVSAAEGNSGTTAFTFDVSLSTASGQVVNVNYATADNTAMAPSDYQPANGIVTFNPGETAKQVTVLVKGDTDFEPTETFFVNLNGATNAIISDNQGIGTITNDDTPPPTPAFLINDAAIGEGDTGTATLNFTVTMSPASNQQTTVDYATANGTANAGSDYQATSGTLTFGIGETSKRISISVNGDTLVEPDETLFVDLSNATGGAGISDNQAVGTITNDDVPQIVISQIYPAGGLTNATYANDYIELFNRGTTTVDFAVTPFSAQFLSTSASAWARTNLTSGTIAPGRYFLIKETSSGANGAALPAADATGTFNLTSTTAGKVALVTGTALLTGNCPGDDGIQPFNPTNMVDFVGYGGSAATANHCYEGSSPSSIILSDNAIAAYRKAGGCPDTNDNSADFIIAAPLPRNSSSTNNCAGGAPPSLFINDVTVTEGNNGTTIATFTVSLSAPAQGADVKFDIATADGTATTANSDYAAKSLTNQFIPAGQTTYTFSVTVNGDTNVEPDETFAVNVTNVTGAAVADGQGSGTIQNDDFPALSIGDVSATEGDSGTRKFTFTVSLSAPAPVSVTFDIATADGTATTADNDYVAKSLTGQTIAASQQTYLFDVNVNGDTAIEPNETFFVNVTNVSGATVTDGQGVGTIRNDDSPALSINDVSANEGDSGATTFTFTVSLSQPAQAGGATFDIATADGTATAGHDYVARTLTSQTIPAGQSNYSFDVSVNGDKLVEPNEAFFVNVTNVLGATVVDSQGQGTIQNDDAANLVISQIYPGGGLTNAIYTNDFIELFNRGTTTIDFSLTPYSAQFLSTSGSTWAKTDLTSGVIAPGQYFLIKEASGGASGTSLPLADALGTINLTSTTSGKIALVAGATLLTGDCPLNPAHPTIADLVGYLGSASASHHCYEGSGPASFTSGNNTIAEYRRAGGCTDTNDNAADFFTSAPAPRNSSSPVNHCAGGATPNLSINDVTVVEGNSGTTTATFTVSLSGPAPGTDVSFDIATADGTATTANNDYVAKSLTNQIIPAGQTTCTFSVNLNGDTNVENDETFFVNVTNVAGAYVADAQGQVTIQNDDLPSLSINDVTSSEGNSGTKTFTFTVSLSAPATSTVTFDLATADGTATAADNDYAAKNLTAQTIGAGQQTYQFDVTVNGDTIIEPNETFFVNVTNVSGATVADAQGQGTIQNDDSPALSINDFTASEGDNGTSTFTFDVSLSQPAQPGGVTFDIATADGSATAANDYVAHSLTNQTIPAGESNYSFDVSVNGDRLVEPNETFLVNVTNVRGATVLDGQGQGTIQNDDVADLKISQVYGGGNNSGATYQDDFVEIFNHGLTTVDFSLTPYSVQYAGVGSNFGTSKTNLTTGSIAPGKYFLVQESGGSTNGVPLPPPDATGSINLSGAAGKVALVAGATFLSSGSCPGDDGITPFNVSDGTVVDFVGYGSVATTSGHCYEGSGPAPAPGNISADFRRAGGCTDTNDNTGDFFAGTPSPRNSSAAANNCAGGATPSLSINDASVAEGNSGTTMATFTVSLSAPAQGADITFDIATADGTAKTSDSDYVTRSLTGQIVPAGQTSYTFTVTVNGDTNVEPDETFVVNVTNVSGASVIKAQGMGTILNDDLPALSINDVSAFEGDAGTKTFSFMVSLSAPAPATVAFDIANADGTATTADNDYIAKNLTGQTIAAGQQTYQFDVTVNGDTASEPDETFFVNVSNVSGATAAVSQGVGTIRNDDTPVLSINSVSANEGNSGTTTFTFTVTSTLAAPAGGIGFDIATADNTATTANGDYVARSVTGAWIPQGQTTYSFDVTVNGDTTPENNETFFVNISNPSPGASISKSQGTGTIQNDDGSLLVISQVYPGGGLSGATYNSDYVELFNRSAAPINFSATPYSMQFLSTGGATWTRTDLTSGTIPAHGYFLIKESGGANGAALPTADVSGSINITSTTPGKVALVSGTTLLTGNCPGDDGTQPFNPAGSPIVDMVGYMGTAATANHCYQGSGPASFISGSNTTADFRKSGGCVESNDNANDFVVAVPNPRNSTTVVNDCSTGVRPDISINDPAPIIEGDTGTQTLNFTVTLSAANNSQTVTVDYATADGTATAGSDYVAASGTVTFNPGETSKPISVTIIGDLLDEPNETFFVNLSNATNASILDSQGVVAINDNDPTPSLSINDLPNIAEGYSGTSIVNFIVTLSAASGQIVTVNYATVDGTATAGGDYTANSGTLTFNPGDTTKSVPVTIKGDTVNEPDETFFVNLSGVSATATISDSQGVGTIKNDDMSANADLTITKTASSAVVLPGNNITYTITVTNNGADPASNGQWTDAPPANTVFQSMNAPPAGWMCVTPDVNSAGTITCTVPSLAVGAPASFTLTLKVNAGTTFGAAISNTAQVTSDTADNNSGNNSATSTVYAVDPNSADLQVTEIDSPDPVDVGSSLTYTIVLTNNGPQPAGSPSLVDNLPAAVSFQSLTPPANWTCSTPSAGGSGQISCSSPNAIAVNGTATLPVHVKVNANVFDNTVISNTVNASTATTDSVPSSNSATSQTTAKGPQLVISQVYGGGGNSSATYQNDFIEIFNRGSRPVDFSITPYSLQYAGATSNFGAANTKTDITSGTVAPGHFFLIQEASGGATGANMTADLAVSVSPINLAATAGKVALVFGTTALSAISCPGDDGVIPFNPNVSTIWDFLGYGSTANCYEGSGPPTVSTTNSNARSVIRTSVCTDANVNSADFNNPTTAPVARNSSTLAVNCP